MSGRTLHKEHPEGSHAADGPAKIFTDNPCKNHKPTDALKAGDGYFNNEACMVKGVVNVAEQSGANVTVGYKGMMDGSAHPPIMERFWKKGLCPVNVHWHTGAEHLSVGQFDEKGTGP